MFLRKMLRSNRLANLKVILFTLFSSWASTLQTQLRFNPSDVQSIISLCHQPLCISYYMSLLQKCNDCENAELLWPWGMFAKSMWNCEFASNMLIVMWYEKVQYVSEINVLQFCKMAICHVILHLFFQCMLVSVLETMDADCYKTTQARLIPLRAGSWSKASVLAKWLKGC